METLLCPPSPWLNWSPLSIIWPPTSVTVVPWPPPTAASLLFGPCSRTPYLWAWIRLALQRHLRIPPDVVFFFKPQKKEQLLDGSIHAKPSEPHLCLLCSFSWRLSLSFGSKTGSPWWRISGHSSPWMVGLSSAQRAQRFWSAPPSSWWPSPWCSNCPNPTRARRPQMHCDLQRLQNVLHQSSAEPCF